jgi:hypothetical protein
MRSTKRITNKLYDLSTRKISERIGRALRGSNGPLSPIVVSLPPSREYCMLPRRPCGSMILHISRWPYHASRLRLRLAAPLPRSPPSRNLYARLSTLSHNVHETGDSKPSMETGLERPEHAVISTFDLFSIGGNCPKLSPPVRGHGQLTINSRPEQLTYGWTNACRKDIHQ